jgi:hypothetical protein
MGIPGLLRRVLEREGHRSVAKMARVKASELGVEIPVATLYSWMTPNPQYRRRPYTPASLRLISHISGEPLERVVELAAQDAREASATAAS